MSCRQCPWGSFKSIPLYAESYWAWLHDDNPSSRVLYTGGVVVTRIVAEMLCLGEEHKLEVPPSGLNSPLISAMASKLLFLRRLSMLLKPSSAFPSLQSSNSLIHRAVLLPVKAPEILDLLRNAYLPACSDSSRNFCSRSLNLKDEAEGPTSVDYRSVLQEDEYHRLADSTIHDLQEKFEEYGDCVEVDGFDIDYGNDVLTLQLGDLGTYVLNKQTSNRQIWLSSPVSGPSRFDWDEDAKAWIYRRNKSNLYKVLESELEQLCGKPLILS